MEVFVLNQKLEFEFHPYRVIITQALLDGNFCPKIVSLKLETENYHI